MAQQLQRWRPDTCGCVIIQTHDPADVTVPIGLSSFESKCPAHASLSDADAWTAIWPLPTGENKRKNLLRNRIMAQHGIEPTWTFTGTGATRRLRMAAPGLNTTQLTALRTWALANLGTDQFDVVASL